MDDGAGGRLWPAGLVYAQHTGYKFGQGWQFEQVGTDNGLWCGSQALLRQIISCGYYKIMIALWHPECQQGGGDLGGRFQCRAQTPYPVGDEAGFPDD